MNKVLFIGSYRDGTGWAQASTDYIRAMHAADIDLVIRPIKLNCFAGQLDRILLGLEQKSTTGVNTVIQHTLPHFMEYLPGAKNIGLFVTETDSAPFTNWVRKLNIMDEVWVVNNEMKTWCDVNGVNKPVKIIPHACDISKFKKEYNKFELPTDGKFVFYFIGELTRRKNITALLRAFHTEFSFNEPVSLVLKVNKGGISAEVVYKELSHMCEVNKNGLRLYKDVNRYHKEIIIPGHLTEDEMMSLHKACDCFVMPSFGEAWCQPAFDAMGFGNTPICTNTGGMKDFIKDGGFLIPGHVELVAGCDEVVPKLNIGYENWYSIDINLLRKQMRFNYQFRNHNMFLSIKEKGKHDVSNYSYEKIGKLIKGALNVF